MKKTISLLLSAVVLMTSLSAVTYADVASTTAVKDTMTGNWDASGLVSTAFYNVGVLTEYNDYSISNTNNYGYNVYKDGRTNVLLNDWNAHSDNWGGINPEFWDMSVSPKVKIPLRNYGGKNWGYVGKKYNASWTQKYSSVNGEYVAKSEEELSPTWDLVPDDKWGNCYDITDYVDNGYIIFELDNVSGDTKNAYFALTSVWSNWCFDYYGGNVPASDASLNKIEHDNLKKSAPYATGVYGVKFEDYYDTTKSGKQTVKIPIKDFVQQNARGCGGETSTFSEAYYKSWTAEKYFTGGVGRTFKPNFFTGAGIARQDSGEGKTFSAQIIKISIVEPTAPTNLTAEVSENGTSLGWTASTDSDVSYEITRTYKGNSVTFSAGKSTSYSDTSASTGKGYTYSVVAIDDTYGIRSAKSNEVTLQSSGISEIVENFALEDIYETTKDGQKPSWETWPSPLAVGPYQAGTAIYFTNDYYAHAVNGAINAVGRPRTYYIHDMYYGGTQNASITYRPQNEGETDYYASEVNQFWGFNGVIYKNKTNVPGLIKDFGRIQQTGYALFDIKIEEGSYVDDAYLAIVHVCTGLAPWSSGHFWNVIGVPLADYYDIEKGGFQQVAVPLRDFDISNPDVLGVFIDNNATTETGGRHQFDRKPLNMAAFGGMGIVRKDSRGIGVYDIDTSAGRANALKSTAKPFAYTANTMLLGVVESPEDVETALTSDGVKITWTDSPTVDVSDYQILRDGHVIATVSEVNTYTDTTAKSGFNYTYGVRAVSPTYENAHSIPTEATAKIPNGAESKLFAHKNGRKFETTFTYEGKMTAEFYAKESATGYIACYSQDGRLKSAEIAPVAKGEWVSASVENCDKTDIVKTFLWNENGEPIYNNIVTDVKTTPKILAIGNSYSQNATYQLHQMAEADGVNLDVTNMYIGGCSLQTHWNNILGDVGAYQICRNGEWLSSYGETAKISELLAEEEWDYITIQQASQFSVDYKTFEPYTTNIAQYLTENVPSADIIFHQTWEYGTDHGKTVFNDQNFKGSEMCAKSLENAKKASAVINSVTGSPMRIIPSGMAVRGVLETNPDYVIWSDGTHLSEAGCYMASLVWYKTLLGGDIMNNKYLLKGLSAAETMMFKTCAENAVNNYSVVAE